MLEETATNSVVLVSRRGKGFKRRWLKEIKPVDPNRMPEPRWRCAGLKPITVRPLAELEGKIDWGKIF